MKKRLFIAGILSFAACAFFLLSGAFHLFGYYHVLDGTAALFSRLHQRMLYCFAIGAVFAAIGIVCMIVRRKI